MEPYYSDEHVTLYHGRCEDVLPTLSGVDLFVTSPPYNLRSDGPTGGHHAWSRLDQGYAEHDDAMPHDLYVGWQRHVVRLMWSALSESGAIFYNHKPRVRGNAVQLPLDLIPSGVHMRQIIVWDRGSGLNRSTTFFVPVHEWIMLLARPDFRTNTRSIDDVWRIPFETGSDHPAPFPLALASRAIESTDAALVADPFAGSGTTLVAAKRAGRKAIGIELSEAYCEIAAKRLAQGVLDFTEGAAS